jgi:hypothetical protein
MGRPHLTQDAPQTSHADEPTCYQEVNGVNAGTALGAIHKMITSDSRLVHMPEAPPTEDAATRFRAAAAARPLQAA